MSTDFLQVQTAVAVLLSAAALPALHTIAYPEKYKPHLHEGGASFFAGKTDHPNFRYYVFNDYYNMECDDTLYNSCSFSVLVYPPIE